MREYERVRRRRSRHLNDKKYEPKIDYRRKRGLVEEINRVVQDVEDDIAARSSLPKPIYVKPGLVEPSAAIDAAPAAEQRVTASVDARVPRAPWLQVPSLLQ